MYIEAVYIETRRYAILIDFSIQLVCLKQYISQWGSQPTLPSHFFPYYVDYSISFNVDWWLSILLSFSYHVLRYLIHRIPSYNGLFLLSSVIYYCNCHHFLIDITSIYYLIVVQYSIAVVSCHRMLYYRNYSQTDYINICDLCSVIQRPA